MASRFDKAKKLTYMFATQSTSINACIHLHCEWPASSFMIMKMLEFVSSLPTAASNSSVATCMIASVYYYTVDILHQQTILYAS